MLHIQVTYVNTVMPLLSYSGIYRPFESVTENTNITQLSSTQLSAFIHIKTILDKMVPLVDESSNLRLEDIASYKDDEETDFQVIFFSSDTFIMHINY